MELVEFLMTLSVSLVAGFVLGFCMRLRWPVLAPAPSIVARPCQLSQVLEDRVRALEAESNRRGPYR